MKQLRFEPVATDWILANNPLALNQFQGIYANSVKEPDAMLRATGEPHPCMTIEAGWSESYPKLVEDVEVWMVGGAAVTKLSLLVKFNSRTGGRFAAFLQAARQVPGGGWAFDPRQVSCNPPFLRLEDLGH